MGDINNFPKLGELFSYPKLSLYEGLDGAIRLPAKNTFIGVEIELENVKQKYHTFPSSFVKTSDGSLKVDGAEFVTVPIRVRYLEMELRRLFDSLKSSSISSRCSVHVHMNVRDFNWHTLYKFMLVYLIFERVLYRMSGDRWNNNFCVPLTGSSEVSSVLKYLSNNSIPGTWYKYFGLNISPIWGGESGKAIGTIEFRQLHGTTNIIEIMQWVYLICALKTAARRYTAEELHHLIDTMNTTSGYYILTEKVFGAAAKDIIALPTFVEDMEKCIANTKKASLYARNIPLTVDEGEKICVE